MSKSLRALLIALSAPILILPVANAGAWTNKKGETYAKVAVNYFFADDQFGENTSEFEEFSDLNLNVYVEHGLRDDLTFFATTSLKEIRNTADGVETSNTGIADLDVGLRYNLINEPVVLSVQGLAKLPFLYDEDDELPLGNGQIDLEGKVLLGKSLGRAGYFGLEAGYRFRAEEPVDEFRFLVEYGVNITEKAYFRTKLDGIHALQDDDSVIDVNTGNPTLPLSFDLGRIEYTLGYQFHEEWFGEITGTSAIYGDNTLRGNNIQVAIVRAF